MDDDLPWNVPKSDIASSMELSERLLGFVTGYTAVGDLGGLALAWKALLPENHLSAVEAILQTHLFAGFPRVINAMALVRKLGVADIDGYWEDATVSVELWQNAGELLCSRIYGNNYSKLRKTMGNIHPDLDKWMLQTGYGRVLSRPGLSARMRELCVLAVLAGQNVPPQLFSHLRGAIHVGATIAECEIILRQTEAIWGVEAQHQALEVFNEVKPKLKL